MTAVTPRFGEFQSEGRKLFSHQVGIEYQLDVCLPASYASSGGRYPVIYLLDGDLFFGMAAALLPMLNYTLQVPEMIIVGIGYNRTFPEWATLRELDFKIPEVQADPPGSHADRFLAALQHEIIPFVETNYRTDPAERKLYGYSSSGFFAIYTLANGPDLFRHYLVGSPDTDLSGPYFQAHDQKLAARSAKPPIDLFLTIGGLEDGSMDSSLAKFDELVATIQARKYPGLRLVTEIYAGEDHSVGGIALTFINGLRQFSPRAKR